MQHYGHADMGIYAEVLEGGTLEPGMPIHIPGE
jgi:MOSC domain-containing protein YiiM